MKPLRALVGLFALSLAGCSPVPQQTSPVPFTPSAPQPSSSTQAAPSSTPAKALPTIADMPDEGRNFGSCKDGKCRVHVKPGDRITTPVEVGGTTLRIKAIEPGSVTFEQTGFGGGTFTATVFDTGSGTGLGSGDRYSIGFFEISEGQAILQIDA